MVESLVAHTGGTACSGAGRSLVVERPCEATLAVAERDCHFGELRSRGLSAGLWHTRMAKGEKQGVHGCLRHQAQMAGPLAAERGKAMG
eukprot:scaffold69216_cov32-Tisochrysis_lutea.AAC.3